MARQIVVDIIGDSSGFSRAVDEAGGAGGRFKNIMGGIGQGIGQAAFGLLDTAISSVVGTLGQADEAFKADQQSQALLAAALQNNIPGWSGNTSAIEANISAWQAKGISDSMQREGLTTLLNKTQDLTAAQNLNSAAIELAAGTGKTYDEAVSEIVSGLNGRVAALAKDGVAIAKNASAADVASAIMDKYKGSQDALAETSAGKTAISQEKVGEAMEKLGGIVDKVSSVALPILADAFTTVIEVVTKVVDAITPVIETVLPHLQDAVKVVGTVFGVVFPVLQTVVETVFKAIGTAIDTFKTAFGLVGTAVGTIIDTMKTVFTGLKTFVGGIFDSVVGAIKGALNIIINAMNVAIDGINAIPDLDVGDVHIGIPHLDHLPTLHQGGIVPGVRGTEVPIMALAGERVSPIDASTGTQVTTVVVNLTTNVTGAQSPEEWSRRSVLALQRTLRQEGITLGAG